MAEMKAAVVVSLIDRLTRPMRQLTGGLSKTQRAAVEAQTKLNRLGDRQKAIERFRELKRATGNTATALDQARAKTASLARQIRSTEKPQASLTRAFEKSKREAAALKRTYQAQQRSLEQQRRALRDADVSTSRLSDHQRTLSAETRDANRALQAQRERLARLEAATKRVADARDRMHRGMARAANLHFVGSAARGVSDGVLRGVQGTLEGLRQVERARGELASLGVKDLDLIVARGREMQGRLAGITAASFVSAAYDIRSGISTLSDEGVASMTAAAAVTAKATKASTEQMTSLFATSYGLFKRQFADLDDGRFGELFAASLAKSVQQFKTTGGAMQRAIESSGAFAVNLGMDMREQLAVLGMMQTSMQAGEAGTALRSFAENAAKAQKAFDELAAKSDNPISVRVLDDRGMLRQMPDILSDLKDRYGSTLDAIESAEIKEAFGTTEAVKLIAALWGQETALRANVGVLRDASAEGLTFTQRMATLSDNNLDSRLTLISQRFDLMKQRIGTALVPVIDRLLPKLEAAMTTVSKWAEESPGLVTALGAVAVVIGVVAAVLAPLLGLLAMVVGTWGMLGFAVAKTGLAFSIITPIIGVLRGGLAALAARAIPAAIAGVRALSVALMTNPIGLIVGLIAIAAGLLIMYWEPVKAWFGKIWDKVRPYWDAFANWIGSVFDEPWALIKALFDWSPLGIIIKHWDPLKAAFAGIGEDLSGRLGDAWSDIKALLDWNPLGEISKAWSPLTSFFGGIWDDIQARFGEAAAFIDRTVALISAPVKTVMDTIGGLFSDDDGEGVVQKSKRLAQATVVGTAVAATPAAAAPAAGAPQSVEIHVHAAPGQSAEEIAREVARILEARNRGALHD